MHFNIVKYKKKTGKSGLFFVQRYQENIYAMVLFEDVSQLNIGSHFINVQLA